MLWCSFFLNGCTRFVKCSWGMRSTSREVTLSVFIISRQIFVLCGLSCQPKRGRTFNGVWVQMWRNMKKRTVKVLKERDGTLSSLLKYAVVFMYLKWWPVPWMGTLPDSHDDGESPLLCWRWLDATGAPHPTWPRDICQRSCHIFWHSTECKWSWMSCGGGVWAPPLVRVWLCFPRLLVVGLWRAQMICRFLVRFLSSSFFFYLCDKVICGTMGKRQTQWLFVFVSMWKSVFTIKLIWYQVTASVCFFYVGGVDAEIILQKINALNTGVTHLYQLLQLIHLHQIQFPDFIRWQNQPQS